MTLRYGNAISLEQSDRPEFFISANPHNAQTSFPDFITTMKENPDVFIVLKEDGNATAETIKFGDSVKLLSIGSKSRGFLTYDPVVVDIDEYESAQITSVKRHKDETKASLWKILKADDFTSKADVKFGDILVFENTIDHVKHHLSCGFNMTHPGLSVPRVTLRKERSAKEKWKISGVSPAISHPEAFAPVLAGPASNKTAYFPAGLNVQSVVIKVSSAIPYIGSGVETALNYFWPPKGVDVWALIKDHVREMAKDLIFDEKMTEFKEKLKSIKTNFDTYLKAPDMKEKSIRITNVLNDLTFIRDEICNAGRPEDTLPYIVATAVIHTTVLREAYVHGQELYESNGVYLGADFHHDQLTEAIKYYQLIGEQAKQNIIYNRQSKITYGDDIVYRQKDYDGTMLYTFKGFFRDEYTGEIITWEEQRVEYGDRNVWGKRQEMAKRYNDRINEVMPALREKLEKFLSPIKLLQYMDPKSEYLPVKVGDDWQ
jgi:hypothetical protein